MIMFIGAISPLVSLMAELSLVLPQGSAPIYMAYCCYQRGVIIQYDIVCLTRGWNCCIIIQVIWEICLTRRWSCEERESLLIVS